jgi:hypothetical protein
LVPEPVRIRCQAPREPPAQHQPRSGCGLHRRRWCGWRGPPAHITSAAGGYPGATPGRYTPHHRPRNRRGSPARARGPAGHQLTAAWWRTAPPPGCRPARDAAGQGRRRQPAIEVLDSWGTYPTREGSLVPMACAHQLKRRGPITGTRRYDFIQDIHNSRYY